MGEFRHVLTHIHSRYRKVMLAYTWHNLKAGCLWPMNIHCTSALIIKEKIYLEMKIK